jgi:hypothetical protein
VPLPQKSSIAPSSFCAARQKLDEAVFKRANQKILAAYGDDASRYCWLGHRLFAIDGSKINLPRQLLACGYSTPGKTAHYPLGLLSCLYELKSQMPFDFDLVSHANERLCALHHLDVLQASDVVVYDRGYFSYLLLHRHVENGIHAFTLNRLFANRADIELNSEGASNSHSPGLGSPDRKTNFKNCIHVLERGLEDLLLLQRRIVDVIQRLFRTILGRHQRVRPNRSFIRRSMRPETKWQPSKERRQAQKAQQAAAAPA